MADIDFIGVIGDAADALDHKSVKARLDALADKSEITILINSPGGFVTEGLAIYDAIRSHPAHVIIEISALAASMASVVAMAGDTIRMSENALLMIHNPGTVIFGTADEFRKQADTLDKMMARMLAIYAKRTGLPDRRISAIMDAETWLDAEEALAHGFIDEIIDPASATAFTSLNLEKLEHVPAAFAMLCSGKGKDRKMATKPKKKAEEITYTPEQIAEIHAAVEKAGLPVAMARDLLLEGTSIEDARPKIIDALADAQPAPTHSHIRVEPTYPRIKQGKSYDAPGAISSAMAEALACRYTGKAPSEEAQQFMDYRFADIAAQCLGKPIGGRASWRTIRAAITHTTSDFPLVLEDAADKILKNRYEAAPSGLKSIGRQVDLIDFRARKVYSIGDAPSLLELPEGAEIKFGTIGEGKETWSLLTYARMFSLSRNAMVNDDLNAFDDLLGGFADIAIDLEAQILVNTLYGSAGNGPNMSDGKALFHADHNNLAASGAVPSVTTLKAAKLAMRAQTNLSGNPINVKAATLVVPAALEVDAEQLLAPLTATKVADQNPFPGTLTLEVESRLDTLSATGWYLATDPMNSGLEYGTLAGDPGPKVEIKDGWSTLGVEFRAVHDFGAGFIDHRGMYRDPGT